MAVILGEHEPEDPKFSEVVYQELRSRLIIGDIAPGEKLSIRTLAHEFGVSTMPVREALKRLETEKALAGSIKRAYRVPDMNPQQAANLFFIRAKLEGVAAELAVDHLTEADVAKLLAYTMAMEEALKQRKPHDFLLNNFKFHSLIYAASGNPDLADVIEVFFARSGPLLGKAIREMTAVKDWDNEHRQIVAAIRAKDQKMVRQLIESDANWGVALFESIYRQGGEPPAA